MTAIEAVFVLGKEHARPSWLTSLKREIKRAWAIDCRVVSLPTWGKLNNAPEVVFFDSHDEEVTAALSGITRGGRVIIAVTHEDARELPRVCLSGLADDVWVEPFRGVEVASKLKWIEQVFQWQELSRINESFQALAQRLGEDLSLASRLQKAKLPKRLPDLKGFRIESRYIAGLRSGGDHFDVALAKAGSRFSLLLSDSSSYGLANAVLSSLMRVAARVSIETASDTMAVVRSVYSELRNIFGAGDTLSLFLGYISRQNLALEYVNFGSCLALRRSSGGQWVELAGRLKAVSRHSPPTEGGLCQVTLSPGDRILVISDGFIEAAGGASGVLGLLNRSDSGDPKDVLNELSYLAKTGIKGEEGVLEQDCTAVVLDVDERILRVA